MKNKLLSVFLILNMLLLLLPLSGCMDSTWEGQWNRTGDATYNRGVVDIYDYTREGFTFDITIYNGNIAGQVKGKKAFFDNAEKTKASWGIPGYAMAYIKFELSEDYQDLDVIFDYNNTEETEIELLGFGNGAFITGRFNKGKVEYMNSSLYSEGVVDKGYDERLQRMTSDEVYMRLQDCFQSYTTKRNDEIGGEIYYGENNMQKDTAAMICFDDGTVSVVITMESGKLLYFSDNAIYDDVMLAYPLANWVDDYKEAHKK